MKKRKPLSLEGYDEIFSTEESRQQEITEKVRDVPLSDLHPFKDHPFHVVDDEAMEKTVESIKKYGVLSPAIVRPSPEGGYELISGHRRKRASELAGLDKMPVIIRNLDNDEATILMVDSNLQRETIFPSERAFAYRMKLEAMKHQAGRPSQENYSQVGNNFGTKSSDEMAEQLGVSKNQIFRFIRLTYLLPELLQMVDDKRMAFNPAVEISYLSEEEQKHLLNAMDYAQCTPSLSQAQRMKRLSQDGKCSEDAMCAVLSEEKKQDVDRVVLKDDVLRKYFPREYTPRQMEETIIKLLAQWQKHREHSQSL